MAPADLVRRSACPDMPHPSDRFQYLLHRYRGPAAARWLLQVIAWHAGVRQGYVCQLGADTLAYETGLGESTVSELRKKLIEEGWLTVVRDELGRDASRGGRRMALWVRLTIPAGADQGLPEFDRKPSDGGEYPNDKPSDGGEYPNGKPPADGEYQSNYLTKNPRKTLGKPSAGGDQQREQGERREREPARTSPDGGEVATHVAAAAGPDGPLPPAVPAVGKGRRARKHLDPGPGPDSQAVRGGCALPDGVPLPDGVEWAPIQQAMAHAVVGTGIRATEDLPQWAALVRRLAPTTTEQAIARLDHLVRQAERQSGQLVVFPRQIPPVVVDQVVAEYERWAKRRAAPSPTAEPQEPAAAAKPSADEAAGGDRPATGRETALAAMPEADPTLIRAWPAILAQVLPADAGEASKARIWLDPAAPVTCDAAGVLTLVSATPLLAYQLREKYGKPLQVAATAVLGREVREVRVDVLAHVGAPLAGLFQERADALAGLAEPWAEMARKFAALAPIHRVPVVWANLWPLRVHGPVLVLRAGHPQVAAACRPGGDVADHLAGAWRAVAGDRARLVILSPADAVPEAP